MDGLLPSGWTVRWEPDDAPLALRLTPAAIASDEALSLAFIRRGIAPWGRTDFPLGRTEVLMRQYPRLDEVWCLHMWIRRERGATAAYWERVSQYVDDCKQGHWTESVAPERAVQSIYAAIVQHALRSPSPDYKEFLETSLLLCEHVDRRLAEGRDLLDDVVTDHPRLERYVAMLQADEKLYREDVERGLRRVVKLKSLEHEREVPMLVLRHPVATQFKLWARRDPAAPSGSGYPLMLVEQAESIVLSADPSRKLDIGWLAAKLDVAEAAARGDSTGVWYDGARHDGTLVAAPTGGTKLTFEQVTRVVEKELRSRPVRNRARWQLAAISLSAVAVLATVVGLTKPWDSSSRVASPMATPPSAPPPARGELYRRIAPATALVVAGQEIGTGVVVAKDFVLTNFHVVSDAVGDDYSVRVNVELGSLDANLAMKRTNAKHLATLVNMNRGRDLALLHVPGLPATTIVELADHDPVPGEHLFCVGNGRIGMLWAMKDGIASALGVYSEMKAALAALDCNGDAAQCAELESNKRSLEASYSGYLLESNCPIAGGDSGGPVVDDDGRLIGLNVLTAEKGATIVSFHIPVATIREFLATMPTTPIHVPPDPRDYNDRVTPTLVDLDGDKKFETIEIDAVPKVLLVDLAARTQLAATATLTRSDVLNYRADLALVRDGERLVAYYDDTGEGHFHRAVVESAKGITTLDIHNEYGTRSAHQAETLLDPRAKLLASSILARMKR